jgi:hypothetical protein
MGERKSAGLAKRFLKPYPLAIGSCIGFIRRIQ